MKRRDMDIAERCSELNSGRVSVFEFLEMSADLFEPDREFSEVTTCADSQRRFTNNLDYQLQGSGANAAIDVQPKGRNRRRRLDRSTDQNEPARRRTRRQQQPETEDLLRCTICTINSKNRACSPCGHMFCDQCVNRLPANRACFICRATVDSILSVYYWNLAKAFVVMCLHV